jgi:hypothetical protein
MEKNLNDLKLYEIAAIIDKDWKNVYFGARPYLNAMYSLQDINDVYGADSGKSIILYFIANATTWRGETAKKIKAHLNKISSLKN